MKKFTATQLCFELLKIGQFYLQYTKTPCSIFSFKSGCPTPNTKSIVYLIIAPRANNIALCNY